jgi:hypothetical protein
MSSSTAADLPSWMILECFVFRRDDDEDGPFPNDAAAPMRASSFTSLGDSFTVALLSAAPPAVSRVYVRWPRGPRSHGSASGTELLTADKGLLLLRLNSDVKLGEDETDKYPYQQDYFIWDCKSITSISLRRLPVCTEPIVLRVGKKNRTLDRQFHPDLAVSSRWCSWQTFSLELRARWELNYACSARLCGLIGGASH